MGDSPIALQTWVQTTLARSDAWSNANPGTAFSYSNTAVTLAGLLVEKISGMSLQDYCKAKIWTPPCWLATRLIATTPSWLTTT